MPTNKDTVKTPDVKEVEDTKVKEQNTLGSDIIIKGETPNDSISKESSGKTFWDLVYFLLTDKNGFIKLVVITSLSVLVILSLGGLLYWKLGSRNLEIINTGGGVIYKIGNEEHLTFLLSAAAPWDSPKGFKVEKGDKLKIQASGRVNLAVHHLVDAAINDTYPPLLWSDPDGMPIDKLNDKDKLRLGGLLVANQPYGALVVGFSPDLNTKPSSENIKLVGKNWEGTVEVSGVLWFAVNDIYLDLKTFESNPDKDKEFQKMYEATDKSGTRTSKRSWEEIRSDKYWNLWFDDNIGDFMITVTKN
ncbi:MAG: hypothetical protein LUM44_21215 [Pyrinomonadaceae bacterium]|nr:hypothetical protein [Pyrinomonadaceae bacterium]